MSRKRAEWAESRVIRGPGTMKQEQKGKEREKVTEKTTKLIRWLFGRMMKSMSLAMVTGRGGC